MHNIKMAWLIKMSKSASGEWGVFVDVLLCPESNCWMLLNVHLSWFIFTILIGFGAHYNFRAGSPQTVWQYSAIYSFKLCLQRKTSVLTKRKHFSVYLPWNFKQNRIVNQTDQHSNENMSFPQCPFPTFNTTIKCIVNKLILIFYQIL